MNENSIKRYTADELRDRTRRRESRTDVARCDTMSDEDVEQAVASDPDWEGVPANWYEGAEAVRPRPKVPVSVRLDADVLEHLRSTGRGWQTRLNAVLRAYMEAKITPPRAK